MKASRAHGPGSAGGDTREEHIAVRYVLKRWKEIFDFQNLDVIEITRSIRKAKEREKKNSLVHMKKKLKKASPHSSKFRNAFLSSLEFLCFFCATQVIITSE